MSAGLAGGALFLSSFALAANQSVDASFSVQMKVPQVPGGGGGGGGGAGDNFPSISNVVVAAGQTSAQITWSANDDKGIQTVKFEYGLTNAYGSVGAVTGTYKVELIGLTASTIYFYKISVTDTANQTATSLSNFQTLAAGAGPGEPPGFPPGGGDNQPPVISDVVATSGITTSSISWSTDETADSQVNYGLTIKYGSSVSDANLVLQHKALLFSLLPNKVYHYRVISADAAGNSASTADAVFTTLKDNVPPSDVSNLQLQINKNSILASWVNPSLLAVPDFAGVKVMRKVNSRSANINDGTLIYNGEGQQFLDKNVAPDINYFYTVFSFDTSENYSGGIFGRGVIPSAGGVEICNNGADDDADNLIDCQDPDCVGAAVCQPPGGGGGGVGEICNNGVDDNGNGLADCADPACANLAGCRVGGGGGIGENCFNQADDDGDGLIDCQDADCAGFSGCVSIVQIPGPAPLFVNVPEFARIHLWDIAFLTGGRKIELKPRLAVAEESLLYRIFKIQSEAPPSGDIGTSTVPYSPTTTSPAVPLTPSVIVPVQEIAPSALVAPGIPDFLPPEPLLEYTPTPPSHSPTVPSEYQPGGSPQGFLPFNIFAVPAAYAAGEEDFSHIITSLAGSNLSVVVPKKALAAVPQSITLKIDNNDQHLFAYNADEQKYYADIAFPPLGRHQLVIEIDYGFGQRDGLGVFLASLPLGDVMDTAGRRLDGVLLTLYRADGARFPAEEYGGQSNPWRTDVNGMYGWVVPNGEYFLVVVKEGYYERRIPAVTIKNNVFNLSVQLVAVPPPLSEVIKADASLAENITQVAANLTAKALAAAELAKQNIGDTARITGDIADKPVVERTVARIVAPAVVGATAVGVAAANWLNFLALLRFLFLQPLLLLGRRKREKWGQVYNALSKLPVDLATVRLMEAETGRIVQSRVTDKNGRYIFITSPGRYRLIVHKTGMFFPTILLKDAKSDSRRVDIYHGEIIMVTEENAMIAANIPLDPVGVVRAPARLRREKYWRFLQITLSWVGLLVTAVSLYITPVWYVGILLGAHLFLFIAFRRLSLPAKAKGWGIVYDAVSRRPIGRVIARLFNADFNKLVDTQITDKAGRYNFLAGDDRYYVTYEHKAYELRKSEVINLLGKEQESIAPDVELKRKQP